jgi:hypothetical protein
MPYYDVPNFDPKKKCTEIEESNEIHVIFELDEESETEEEDLEEDLEQKKTEEAVLGELQDEVVPDQKMVSTLDKISSHCPSDTSTENDILEESIVLIVTEDSAVRQSSNGEEVRESYGVEVGSSEEVALSESSFPSAPRPASPQTKHNNIIPALFDETTDVVDVCFIDDEHHIGMKFVANDNFPCCCDRCVCITLYHNI